MSLILRTIRSFPSGRTTSQLAELLDLAFDRAGQERMRRDLLDHQRDRAIALGRDGRWRAKAPPPDPVAPEAAAGGPDVPLRAVAMAVGRGEVDVQPPIHGGEGAPDPRALLRYYKAALRADPRGAITEAFDRHGAFWQLIAPDTRWFLEEDRGVRMTVVTDALPATFREALDRRDDAENGLALGWPLAVGRRDGVPVVRPVGLLSAAWSIRQQGTSAVLSITLDDATILPNPDWLAAAARGSGWSVARLSDRLTGTGGTGLDPAEFRARLREALATATGGRALSGGAADAIAASDEGIRDAAALFLATGGTFTAGAVRDLDAIAGWPDDRLAATPLPYLLGRSVPSTEPPDLDPVGAGPLNAEQIAAARSAVHAPVSLVTGPPGTGKSQSIAAMVATALADGLSVVVASRNHQALDAVEDRLRSIAPATPFAVRTRAPDRGVDVDMRAALAALLNEPDAGVPPPSLAKLDARRREAADLHARLGRARSAVMAACAAADRQAGEEPNAREPRTATVFERLLRLLFRRRRTPPPGGGTDLVAGAPAEDVGALGQAYVEVTAAILAEAQDVLPTLLAARCALPEAERAALARDAADLDLRGTREIPADLARRVVSVRPLWLASLLGTPKRIPLVEGLFDLAIIDEASQCDIGAALPLLARAKRVVIVGDDRQLGFVPALGAAQDRNLMAAQGLPSKGMGRFAEGARSLFDLARDTEGVTRTMLRKQYRSAPAITGYISDAFYGGRLEAAVDPAGLRVPDGARAGLAWEDVPGRQGRDRNANAAEAEAMATHVAAVLAAGYEGSVGIVTPFRDQVRAIEDALRGRIAPPALSAAELKVGTVDAFQGQERDLVLFSPVIHTHSPASTVAFVQRDWRRINVAISRARAVAHVFGDLTYARSGAVRALARLAARATEPPAATSEGVYDSWPERRMAAGLTARGLAFTPQYDLAGRRLDFALFHGDVRLDLEVDGRRWHLDADGGRKLDDVFRDAQLRAMGWRVRRVWASDVMADLDGCLDAVERDLGRI